MMSRGEHVLTFQLHLLTRLTVGLVLGTSVASGDPVGHAGYPDFTASEARLSRQIDKEHMVHLQNGRFRLTRKSDMDRLFTQVEKPENRCKVLLLYFHGGLVKDEVAVANSKRLLKQFSSAGAYPVCFIWKSGLNETITQHPSDFAHLPHFHRLILKLARLVDSVFPFNIGSGGYVREQTARGSPIPSVSECETPIEEGSKAGSARATCAEDRQFEEFLQRDPDVKAVAEEIARMRMPSAASLAPSSLVPSESAPPVADAQQPPLCSPETRRTALTRTPGSRDRLPSQCVETTGRSPNQTCVDSFREVLRRVREHVRMRQCVGRGHGPITTVVEEVYRELGIDTTGQKIWNDMKSATEAAFGQDSEEWGGTAFLSGLRDLAARHNLPKRILLIGHSAGAVYISNFLRHAARSLPPEIKFEIIFLAPAITFADFDQGLHQYQDRIAAIRIFDLTDRYERNDHLVPGIYHRSLLYFISGLLEALVSRSSGGRALLDGDTPLMGMKRYFSGQFPYDAAAFPEVSRVRESLGRYPNSLVWSTQSREAGLESGAKKHAGFYTSRRTLRSIAEIVRHGFVPPSNPSARRD